MAITVKGSVKANGQILGGVQKTASTIVKELTFNNRFEFPSIGRSDLMYVATDENRTYRFDEESLTYYCIGSDYNEIKTIKCGLD